MEQKTIDILPALELLKQAGEEKQYKITLDIYTTYMDNMNASRQLQIEILKGITAGENIYLLFLKAARAITAMTGNSSFYNQVENDIHAIYGQGLKEKPLLKAELQETKDRLQKLMEAARGDNNTHNTKRIAKAIKAHESRIAKLESQVSA